MVHGPDDRRDRPFMHCLLLNVAQGERRMIRIVLMLALPVAILSIFLTVTILLSWVSGTGLCGTWMALVLPATYCR
jgi:hypothetical protein